MPSWFSPRSTAILLTLDGIGLEAARLSISLMEISAVLAFRRVSDKANEITVDKG